MVADLLVVVATGDDGGMAEMAAVTVDATEVATMIEMMITMIGEIAEVLRAVEADGLGTTCTASHHCRRRREMGILGRRPRRALA